MQTRSRKFAECRVFVCLAIRIRTLHEREKRKKQFRDTDDSFFAERQRGNIARAFADVSNYFGVIGAMQM